MESPGQELGKAHCSDHDPQAQRWMRFGGIQHRSQRSAAGAAAAPARTVMTWPQAVKVLPVRFTGYSSATASAKQDLVQCMV